MKFFTEIRENIKVNNALINLDPVITILLKSGDAKLVADTRKVKESESFFGGTMPAGCLYAPVSFVEKNPKTVQALTNAIVRADDWLAKATPEEVAKVVPASYLMGNRGIYLAGFEGNRDALSPGRTLPGRLCQDLPGCPSDRER